MGLFRRQKKAKENEEKPDLDYILFDTIQKIHEETLELKSKFEEDPLDEDLYDLLSIRRSHISATLRRLSFLDKTIGDIKKPPVRSAMCYSMHVPQSGFEPEINLYLENLRCLQDANATPKKTLAPEEQQKAPEVSSDSEVNSPFGPFAPNIDKK